MDFIDKKLEKEGFKRMNPRSTYNVIYVKEIRGEYGHFVEIVRHEDSDGNHQLYLGSYLRGGIHDGRHPYQPLTFRQLMLFLAKMMWLKFAWMTKSVIPKRKSR